MRVAQVISRKSCDSGGSLQALLLAKTLSDLGADVLFISKGGGCAERARELGLKHLGVPMKGYLDLRSIVDFVRIFKREEFDAVHCHKGLALFTAASAKIIGGLNFQLFANRGVSFRLDFLSSIKYRIPQVNAVIAVAHALADQLYRSGIRPEKVKVIYGSVDERFYSVEGAPERKRFSVALIGNFRPWKGHAFLARSLKPLFEKRRDVFLVFAGKEKKNVLREVRSIIGERFVSHGYRRDVERVMAGSDLVVNASTAGEGLPGVLREAMAVGRAVVATKIAGSSEIVRHGKTGLLADVNQSSLLEAVRVLVENPLLRKKLSLNAKKFSLCFKPLERARKLLKLYAG